MEPRKAEIDTRLEVPIIHDSALAGPVADGRLIPVLIFDKDSRPEVSEAVRLHEHIAPGDLESQWATSRDLPNSVLLLLRFQRPIEVEFFLRFSIDEQAILVDMMLSSGAVYLQPGTRGDRLQSTLDAARILAELPETGFRPHWEQLLLRRMTRVMSNRLGVSRKRARPAAERMIDEMRRLAQFRLTSGGKRQGS